MTDKQMIDWLEARGTYRVVVPPQKPPGLWQVYEEGKLLATGISLRYCLYLITFRAMPTLVESPNSGWHLKYEGPMGQVWTHASADRLQVWKQTEDGLRVFSADGRFFEVSEVWGGDAPHV